MDRPSARRSRRSGARDLRRDLAVHAGPASATNPARRLGCFFRTAHRIPRQRRQRCRSRKYGRVLVREWPAPMKHWPGQQRMKQMRRMSQVAHATRAVTMQAPGSGDWVLAVKKACSTSEMKFSVGAICTPAQLALAANYRSLLDGNFLAWTPKNDRPRPQPVQISRQRHRLRARN